MANSANAANDDIHGKSEEIHIMEVPKTLHEAADQLRILDFLEGSKLANRSKLLGVILFLRKRCGA